MAAMSASPSSNVSHASSAAPTPVTLRTLRRRVREGEKIPVLTAYDAQVAGRLFAGGVDVLLVGDSAAQVVLGLPGTVHAPLEFMLTITAAVKHGAPQAFVIGDMPFMSYQASLEQGMVNAGRFMTQGFADAVKLEVDHRDAELIEKLTRAGVPAIAHIGFKPQQTGVEGGPRVAGRTDEQIEAVVRDAVTLTQAGASMVLLEAATAQAGQAVVDAVAGVGAVVGGGVGGGVVVIGCGAGPACHGHVVVLHDWLGLTDRPPSFVTPMGKAGEQLTDAGRRWAELVRSGQYLADGGPYHMTS